MDVNHVILLIPTLSIQVNCNKSQIFEDEITHNY